jgi:hypothetical protein
MDASMVAEEVPLHVFDELGTLLRCGAVEREVTREIPLENADMTVSRAI